MNPCGYVLCVQGPSGVSGERKWLMLERVHGCVIYTQVCCVYMNPSEYLLCVYCSGGGAGETKWYCSGYTLTNTQTHSHTRVRIRTNTHTLTAQWEGGESEEDYE